MPTSSESTGAGQRSASVGSRVAVNAEVTVPRAFTRTVTIPFADGRTMHAVVAVVVSDDGAAKFGGLHVEAPPGGLGPDELRALELADLVQLAYTNEILHQLQQSLLASEGEHHPGWSRLELSDDRFEQLVADARRLARGPRGPYKVTDDFLACVVDQHAAGGVKRVMKENDVSERTARRWLHSARERGLTR